MQLHTLVKYTMALQPLEVQLRYIHQPYFTFSFLHASLCHVHDDINPFSKRELNMGRNLNENCFPFNRALIIQNSPHDTSTYPPPEFFWKNDSLGLVVGAVGSLVGMSAGLQLVPFRKPQRHRTLHHLTVRTGRLLLSTVVTLPVETRVSVCQQKVPL